MTILNDLTEILDDLARARREHFRLVWIAGGKSGERSALLRALAEANAVNYVDLGKKMSSLLIDIPAPLRTASVEDCFADCLGMPLDEIVAIDHLEILFEPTLKINPIALIQGASRSRTILASWPGIINGSHLSFGSSDHPEYVELSEQELESIVHSI